MITQGRIAPNIMKGQATQRKREKRLLMIVNDMCNYGEEYHNMNRTRHENKRSAFKKCRN